ncbi:MAG: hypothetical protein QXG03_00395 [Halalkalicoccus sp.]
MGEQKKTLVEINVENFEFSPSPRLGGELGKTLEKYEETGSKLGLFGSKGESEAESDESDEESGGLFSSEETDESGEVEAEDEESEDDSGSGIGLLVGLLFLLVVAAVAKKFVAGDEVEEYEEVELSEYEN